MSRISVKQLKQDDKTLLNLYQNFVLSRSSLQEKMDTLTTEKLKRSLVEFIRSHIEILGEQTQHGGSARRLEYITGRLIFWKNILLYEFNEYEQLTPQRPPSLFGNCE